MCFILCLLVDKRAMFKVCLLGKTADDKYLPCLLTLVTNKMCSLIESLKRKNISLTIVKQI